MDAETEQTDQMTLKRSWGRLEHSNRSTLLILELCGMREQGVWGVDTITTLFEIFSKFCPQIVKVLSKTCTCSVR